MTKIFLNFAKYDFIFIYFFHYWIFPEEIYLPALFNKIISYKDIF